LETILKMLKLKDLHTYYGNIHALKGIDLEVSEGEVISLIGANGAGKSTTLMTTCGIVPAKKGSIKFKGKDITHLPSDEIVKLGICQVPEGRRIFPYLTVAENLEAGGTLSGGEQQMLAISRAVMARPKLLLLDEPSLGLAPIIVKQIFLIIKKINEDQGTTIFIVEQNANLALKAAHRGYVMENGLITMTDTGANLMANEDVKKAYLGI
jgi:branched-chain amino acid transport system ATP-binding protein